MHATGKRSRNRHDVESFLYRTENIPVSVPEEQNSAAAKHSSEDEAVPEDEAQQRRGPWCVRFDKLETQTAIVLRQTKALLSGASTLHIGLALIDCKRVYRAEPATTSSPESGAKHPGKLLDR
eukprot:7749979-Pyramimonas_sp.AAC.1